MRNATLVVIALLVAATAPLAAQVRPVRTSPNNWVSLYAQMYTSMDSFEDPDSNSRWAFEDNAFGFGAALLRQFGQSLLLGADFTYARPDYESTPLAGGAADEGSATVATAMLLGRIAYGGVSDLGFYLTGGIGTVAYNLEHLDGWNSDFALRAGTGLEYRFRESGAVFLEWGRIWGYHEKEGVTGGRANHSVLKLGGRVGF